jgi:DNA-binding NarL/FixJ family response regulator
MDIQNKTKESEGTPLQSIRIMLADDHKILRSGLRGLLEKERGFIMIAEAEDGRMAVDLAMKLSPDVAIIDISMPNLNGIEATRQITSNSSRTKVIILSLHSGQKLVAEVFRAGASGYLLKGCDVNEVFAAIRAVAAGETYICPQIATVLRDDYLQRIAQTDISAPSTLSPREREVLQLMAEGNSTKEIAFTFNLSVKTVEVHRQRIMGS